MSEMFATIAHDNIIMTGMGMVIKKTQPPPCPTNWNAALEGPCPIPVLGMCISLVFPFLETAQGHRLEMLMW